MRKTAGYFCVPALILALVVILTALAVFVTTLNPRWSEHEASSMPEARGGENSSTRVCVDGSWHVVEKERVCPIVVGGSEVPCKTFED